MTAFSALKEACAALEVLTAAMIVHRQGQSEASDRYSDQAQLLHYAKDRCEPGAQSAAAISLCIFGEFASSKARAAHGQWSLSNAKTLAHLVLVRQQELHSALLVP